MRVSPRINLGPMLAFLVLGLCAPGWADEVPPQEATRSLEGRILVVRGARGGVPQITDGSGKRTLLVGSLQEELLALDGHPVAVWGWPADKVLDTPALDVARYEIQDSGDGKPEVGVLARSEAEGKVLLRRSEDTLVVSAGSGLMRLLNKRLGCKVWLKGKQDKGAMRVSSFGVLTCNAPAVLKDKKEPPEPPGKGKSGAENTEVKKKASVKKKP